MALTNVLVFAVLKIFHNLVFVQNIFFALLANASKISKVVQSDIAFILNVLSETVNVFE